MTTTNNNTMTLFPMMDDEVRSEIDNGLYLCYRIDSNRIPVAIGSELVQTALDNEDYIIPAQWIVNMLAAMNAEYALMVNPDNINDAAICVYLEGLDAFASVDITLDGYEVGYLSGLVG